LNFLVDAQLPQRLALWPRDRGHNTVHTLDLPLGNKTSDTIILRLALEEDRIVVTKDADFFESWLVLGQPHRMILVATGNIRNEELLQLFAANIHVVEKLLETKRILEISQKALTTRG